jgi:transketolase
MLSCDAVQKANSGHPGMPMGMADIAEVLWNDFLKHNPANPHWSNRDRFILSNGHGSMLLYSLLYLSGYGLSIEEIQKFRQLNSKTPGHPEYDLDLGVETTTGPLGQGLGNAVGMALAEKILSEQFNEDDFPIVDHFTYVFSGDGCMMEGISHEVCSLAGTLQLGKLICFYDDNGISIDGEVQGWFTENVCQRFKAYGWHVIKNIDGHNPEQVKQAIREAQDIETQPSLLACKTIIGFGAPNKAGTADTHGAPLGEEEILAVREKLQWDYPPFEIPDEIKNEWNATKKGQAVERHWMDLFNNFKKNFPAKGKELQKRLDGKFLDSCFQGLEVLIDDLQKNPDSVATRKSSLIVLNALEKGLPELIGGSADLTGSNCTYHRASKAVTADDVNGNYIFYGVREFGMGAIMNGIALHGGFIPYGGTFLTFSDYSRNSLRMSALMELGVIHVFTHDSIGLGEDGPTHQPVEHLPSLRLIPGMNVWRPCDTLETLFAWRSAVENRKNPTALVLTRQTLSQWERSEEQIKKISRGGYVLKDGANEQLDAIIIATGSEVHLAMNAAIKASESGHSVRVVSIPCLEIFQQQPQKYLDGVLPPDFQKVMVIEAAITSSWFRYVGPRGCMIGMESYGKSAPGSDLFKHFGFSNENVYKHLITMIEN